MAISEWDRRQLCPDGACVGVIGPDGTCKVCGRVAPDWGDERRRGLVAAGDDAEDDGEGKGDGDGEPDEIAPSAPAVLGEMKEWQRRRLCSDGACVGVIGPDGRCKVCGKPATGADADAEDEDAGDESEDEDADEEGAEDGEEAAADEGDDEDEDAENTDADEDDEDEDQDEDDDEEEDDDDEPAAAGDLDDRKLCPDGACIGVIGPDGRCKVCGKEAAE
jgi:hypothetical protein